MAGEEDVKGFIVEGDLFAGYGLHQKAIDQYQRVVDAIPHHIEAHEKMRDMYAKSGELSKAANECLILANIFTARGDSENANRNFASAYQYDPQLAPIADLPPSHRDSIRAVPALHPHPSLQRTWKTFFKRQISISTLGFSRKPKLPWTSTARPVR